MKIIESTTLIELYQFRFPKSKKKRIRKKWRKREENYRERDKIIKVGNILYVSPSAYRKLSQISSKDIEPDILEAFNKGYWDLL